MLSDETEQTSHGAVDAAGSKTHPSSLAHVAEADAGRPTADRHSQDNTVPSGNVLRAGTNRMILALRGSKIVRERYSTEHGHVCVVLSAKVPGEHSGKQYSRSKQNALIFKMSDEHDLELNPYPLTSVVMVQVVQGQVSGWPAQHIQPAAAPQPAVPPVQSVAQQSVQIVVAFPMSMALQ